MKNIYTRKEMITLVQQWRRHVNKSTDRFVMSFEIWLEMQENNNGENVIMVNAWGRS